MLLLYHPILNFYDFPTATRNKITLAVILRLTGERDIEAILEQIKQNGGKVLLSKTSTGEYGFIAHVEDSEGNRVALHCPMGD